MIYLRPALVLVACLLGGVSLGGLVGFYLGRFTPDYYRAVFDVPESAPFDAVQAGVGLGVSQGLVAGSVIGTILVVTVEFCARSRNPD
jgi:hypothetical protein